MHPSMDEWPADSDAAATPKMRRAPPDLHDEAETSPATGPDDAAHRLIHSGSGRFRPIALALSAAVVLAGVATAGLSLFSRNASLEANYRSLASSLSDLQSQFAKTSEAMQSIEGQVAAVSGKLPQLERSSTGSAAQVELLWNEAAEARAGLAGLTGQDGTVVRIAAQAEKQRAELKKLIDGLRSDVTTARTSQAGLDEALRTLSPLPAELAAQRTDFARQIETVSRRSEEDRGEIARLRTQIGEGGPVSGDNLAAFERQQSELSRKIDALESGAARDRSDVADVKKRVDDPVHGIAQVAATLESQRAELSSEIADVRRALDINVTAITLLQRKLTSSPLSTGAPRAAEAEPRPQQERATAPAATPSAPAAFVAAPITTVPAATPSAPAASVAGPITTASTGAPPSQSAGAADKEAKADAAPAAPPRIVLRMIASSEARAHAKALQARLRAQGLQVERAGRVRSDARSSTVTYYHDQDRPSADRVAAEVTAAEARRGQVPEGGEPPPPGTIEVLLVR